VDDKDAKSQHTHMIFWQQGRQDAH